MKRIIFAVIGILFWVQTSHATLLALDDSLVYDDTTDLVWYRDTNYFHGTYQETMDLLDTVSQTASINGVVYDLDWGSASMDAMQTLVPQLTNFDNNSLFTAHYTSTSNIDFFDPPGPYRRTSFSGRIGTPWDVPDVSGDIHYSPISFLQYMGGDPNDYPAMVNYNEKPWQTGRPAWSTDSDYQWVVARTIPTPEPSTFILIGIGFASVALKRKKS